jgi:hypothetical protein
MLRTFPGITAEVIKARLANRMERQRRVLYRGAPPAAWFVVDEVSLYRRVGSDEVMAGQCARLAEAASMANVTVQILPAVEHPAGACCPECSVPSWRSATGPPSHEHAWKG